MKLTILLATAGAATCSASPATAADAGVPEASDFTGELPAATQLRERTPRAQLIADRRGGYGLEGPLLYRTPPISAPRSFDLVGVAGETHALEYRARLDGGEWSDWAEADNGDPVHTGESDEVQVRSRGVPIEGELHYVDVDVDGRVAAAEPRRPATRAGDRDRRSVPEPRFITRSQWGANNRKTGCTPRTKPDLGNVKAAVVHHTVSTDNYTEAQAPGLVLGICRYHRDANGWNDIGYQALVDRFGNLYEGRAGGVEKPVVGAQTEGHNLQTAGVALIGNRSDFAPSAAERKTLINYLAWRLDVADIEASGRTKLTSSGGASTRTPNGKTIRVPRIISHSDTNFTECAGTELRAELPKIRRSVQRRLDQYGDETAPIDPESPVHPPVDPAGGVTPRR